MSLPVSSNEKSTVLPKHDHDTDGTVGQMIGRAILKGMAKEIVDTAREVAADVIKEVEDTAEKILSHRNRSLSDITAKGESDQAAVKKLQLPEADLKSVHVRSVGSQELKKQQSI